MRLRERKRERERGRDDIPKSTALQQVEQHWLTRGWYSLTHILVMDFSVCVSVCVFVCVRFSSLALFLGRRIQRGDVLSRLPT